MKKEKREKLKQAGWKVGNTQDFLNLSDEEIALINMKRSLMELVRQARKEQNITQKALAKLLRSSQSRVAKMEAKFQDISLDLIIRALRSLGVTNKEIGKAISSS